jgi:hypothetical protein
MVNAIFLTEHQDGPAIEPIVPSDHISFSKIAFPHHGADSKLSETGNVALVLVSSLIRMKPEDIARR